MFAGLKSSRRERAELERARVMITSMMESSEIQDTFDAIETGDFFEGVTAEEIEDMIDKIPETDLEDEQVDKILGSEENLTIDQILGIEDDGTVEIDV